jgi:hypothetical protein
MVEIPQFISVLASAYTSMPLVSGFCCSFIVLLFLIYNNLII